MEYSESEKQELKIIELDSHYSTTRCVSRLKPIVENNLNNKIQFNLFTASENKGVSDGGLRCAGFFKYSLPEQPLITVITVVFNGEKYLEQTIQSVINQNYNNVEYIVIDGGSTYQTLNIIRQYEDMIDYWVSEPDKGIADAMNKGISFSTGEYIIFIHADDYFLDNHSLDAEIRKYYNFDIVLFNIFYGDNLKRLSPRGFNFWMNFKTGVYHQAALCRREVFNIIGNFDTEFKVAMDYDFFLRAYRRGLIVQKLSAVLSVMRDTGISSRKDIKSLFHRLEEEKKIHEKNCPGLMMAILYKIYWLIYPYYKKLVM